MGKVGAREESCRREEAKEAEGKPGGAETKGKEERKGATGGAKGATGEGSEREEHEGGREEPKPNPETSKPAQPP